MVQKSPSNPGSRLGRALIYGFLYGFLGAFLEGILFFAAHLSGYGTKFFEDHPLVLASIFYLLAFTAGFQRGWRKK